jgi:hypothetical protein
MAAELKDLRAKVSVESYAFLEARSRATGEDISTLVREILHAWAIEQLNVATVAHRLMRAEGLPGIVGELEALAGNKRESGRGR